MSFLFEKLRVYQLAIEFSLKVDFLARRPPSPYLHLADQLVRAADSVPANIAEGSGRTHKKERQQFFKVARGSVNECAAHLELCKRKGWISYRIAEALQEDLDKMARMLTSLIAKQ